MTDQATTSGEVETERPEAAAEDSDTTTETATPTEERPTESEDSLGVDYNLDHLPQDAKEYISKVEKDFKSAYTKKRQEESATSKRMSLELEQTRSELEELKRQWQTALSDPNQYDAYREINGFRQPDPDPTQINSVEDLVNFYENKISTLESSITNQVDEKLNSKIKDFDIELRWNKAQELRKAKDSTFAAYEKLVENEIRANPDRYRKVYTGANEDDILSMALQEVLGPIEPAVKAAKSTKQETIQKKKAASTVSTSTPISASKGIANTGFDKDAIIARIKDRYGSLT